MKRRDVVFLLIGLLLGGVLAAGAGLAWRAQRRAVQQSKDEAAQATLKAAAEAPIDDFGGQASVVQAPAGGPAVIHAEPLTVKPRSDGILVWEAEWANRLHGSWECLPKEGASGAVIWARHGSGRSIRGPVRPDPRTPFFDLGAADYVFEVPAAGTYRLFLRAFGPDGCADSCWAGLDTFRNLVNFPEEDGGLTHPYGQWFWFGGEGETHTLSAGPHFLHLEVREEGFAIDQLALVPAGVAAPKEVLTPSLVPGSGRWPRELRLAAAEAPARNSTDLGPFDCALTVSHHLLFPEDQPAAVAWIWVRSNVQEPHTIRVELSAPEAEVAPGNTILVTLSGAAPVARAALRLTYPAGTPRRGYVIRATATCAELPQAAVERRTTVQLPLDWRVLGPLNAEQKGAASRVLKSARRVDFAAPLDPSVKLPAWVQAATPQHYDVFGSLNLNGVFGPRSDCAAFVATRIHVRRAGTYRVLAGGDDGLSLRLDGAPFLKQELPWDVSRPLVDMLRYYEVPLSAGDHFLVGLVDQTERYWEMRLEFHTAEGLPTEDVWGLPAE